MLLHLLMLCSHVHIYMVLWTLFALLMFGCSSAMSAFWKSSDLNVVRPANQPLIAVHVTVPATSLLLRCDHLDLLALFSYGLKGTLLIHVFFILPDFIWLPHQFRRFVSACLVQPPKAPAIEARYDNIQTHGASPLVTPAMF